MSNLEYLYVIEFKNGTIKIGRSTQVNRRIEIHRQAARAHGNPVERVWVSDAHEDSKTSETSLKAALGDATFGSEWYQGMAFNYVVRTAEQFVNLSTDSELYYKNLMEAKRMVEAHTGRQINMHQTSLQSDVLGFFLIDENSYVMSSVAFQHYLQNGGTLSQKYFLAALEQVGVEKRRTNQGSRLHGIAIRNLK